MSKSGLWPKKAYQKHVPVFCRRKAGMHEICEEHWEEVQWDVHRLLAELMAEDEPNPCCCCFVFFFILHGSASYKLISVWISYFFYNNTTFTGQVLAGMIPPPPASMTPFCTGHQAFAFLDTFQVRWFGLALNYSLKKPMWISRKLNWPVQFNSLVTWTTQSKQFQDYSCKNLIRIFVKAPFKSVPF